MSFVNLKPVTNHQPIEIIADRIELGQWFWVLGDEEWLGCVMHIGSNFVLLEEPDNGSGHRCERVHINNIHLKLRVESDAATVIRQKIDESQRRISDCMDEIRAITARLGVDQINKIGVQPDSAGNGRALSVLSSTRDVDSYKQDLIAAKQESLPNLFKQIEAENKTLAKWMLAESLPLKAVSIDLKKSLESIDHRIFNVSLYAGLTETVVKCADGVGAAMTDKLHVMQRKLYMDEECLLNYLHGGMEFGDIEAFDRWLCQRENRERMLPFPRTIVAMQVRRNRKQRDGKGIFLSEFINIKLAELDKLTFLYIRNGEQVYRLDCDLDFGDLIFPDKHRLNLTESMMMRKDRYYLKSDVISMHDYEERAKAYYENEKNLAAWLKENSGKHSYHSPYRKLAGYDFRPDDWVPLDPEHLYFDDYQKDLDDQVRKYNRIALIIQGLFDRSPVLHPHPPVQTWVHESFLRMTELVYDGSDVLNYGEASDFEAYKAMCNESIDADSVLIGQHLYWMQKEAVKESRRMDLDWRCHSDWRPELFEPYGNPGPGLLSKPCKWQPRARNATFSWFRKRLRDDAPYRFNKHNIRATITVPVVELFNVSAYRPGDYKQFFMDPRTREQYLEWAPMLLAAEEYHAGKRTAKEPV